MRPNPGYNNGARMQPDPGYAVGTVPASRPVAAQPLPPVGSVSERSVPQTEYRVNRGEQPLVTGAIATPEPQIGGFKAGGWSADGGATVTARAGEDINTLSNRYGVPSDAIMKVNGLRGRALSPGQQVIIPVYNATAKAAPASAPAPETAARPRRVSEEQPYPDDPAVETARASVGEAKIRPVATTPAGTRPRVATEPRGIHVVKPGETLTSIAKAYGTTRPRLAKENGIDEWMSVKIGQQLKVPGAAVRAAAAEVPQQAPRGHAEQAFDNRPPRDVPVAAATEMAPRPAVPARPAKPVKIEAVRTAATQGHIAAKPVPVRSAQIKPVAKPATVRPVATAVVKPVHVAEATPLAKVKTKPAHLAAAAPSEAEKSAKLKAEKLALAKSKPISKPVAVKTARVEAAPQPAPAVTASIPHEPGDQQAASQTVAVDAAAAKPANPEFRWPVKGRVIQDFGRNSDGINISVPEGTEVKAAEDGVVAYAGNELKGYGNLILIRHANGYVTAYGHAKDLEVKKGDAVRRGQVIATAGQTGNVTSPQLLFEVRKGAAPVNPRQYLAGN
ncbi:peptidoglycan DD-metalloendopeptidase family protein [Labrys monachus]|uniref:Murein DD-endopeptidase MepM/ murein hydrolase activator NlpD n=1 Tax=Labrys monachus TaxID=217067 RepID=A0ABU0FF93_9HYPH|nr:peptidoglycan DD-metalloendopeptidase family protein [Labrys monachus]MDQ0393002.1 murein DD-endopeptidase MepM/ murein hydrolase activator NlpD [Labrys monachus]